MLRWLTPRFLFEAYPGPLSSINRWLFLGFFTALLGLAIAAQLQRRKAIDKVGSKWWWTAAMWLWTFGLTGLLATFFAWEQAPFLAARIVLATLLLGLLAVSVWMTWQWFRKLPARRIQIKQHREYVKYLPSKK